MDTFDKYESNVRSYCRRFTAIFDKAINDTMIDSEGNEYIDFFCGAGACNYGHNNEYITDKIIKYVQNNGIMHSMDMYTVAKEKFIETFQNEILKPRGLNYKVMFTGPTGTNAIEAALKLARKVTGRQNLFSFMGAFHGMTLGSLSLTSEREARDGAGVALDNVTHIPTPYMFPELDAIKYMERLVDDDHSGVDIPAAVIIEAVQAEGGIYVMPFDFMKRLRKFCTNHKILLILDEVQVGNNRTGKFFAFEHSEIVPDIVCIAKSIGGEGLPFSLALFKPELDIWKPGEHNGTFRGFQLSMVAGRAGIQYMQENNIQDVVIHKAQIIEEGLKKICSDNDDLCYRGIGCIWGIDFSKYPSGTADKVSRACYKRKLVIELSGREDCVLKIMPPLTVTEEHLRAGIDIIAESVKEVLQDR